MFAFIPTPELLQRQRDRLLCANLDRQDGMLLGVGLPQLPMTVELIANLLKFS